MVFFYSASEGARADRDDRIAKTETSALEEQIKGRPRCRFSNIKLGFFTWPPLLLFVIIHVGKLETFLTNLTAQNLELNRFENDNGTSAVSLDSLAKPQKPESSSIPQSTKNGLDVEAKHATVDVKIEPIKYNAKAKGHWPNPYGIVHVVNTRFMQHQPDFVHLGQARLALFKALTLPSLIQQKPCGSNASNQTRYFSTKNLSDQHARQLDDDNTYCFLWILRIDPNLDLSIRSELLQLTKVVKNLIVLASNENPQGFDRVKPDKSIMVSGSFELWTDYYEAAQTLSLLETRLDADDGLVLDFFDRIQRNAAEEFQKLDNFRPWLVWCVETHLEWQQYATWNLLDKRGSLLGLKTKKCITPGLTWGINRYGFDLARQISRPPMSVQHHKVHSTVRECQGDKKRSKREDQTTGCLIYLNDKSQLPLAMRLRTITSAGLANVILKEIPPISSNSKELHWKDVQKEIWKLLPRMFGANQTQMELTKKHLEGDLTNIVKDAERGQCTPGHSCKESSRLTLQTLRKLHLQEQVQK